MAHAKRSKARLDSQELILVFFYLDKRDLQASGRLNASITHKLYMNTSCCNGVDIFACQTRNGNDQTHWTSDPLFPCAFISSLHVQRIYKAPIQGPRVSAQWAAIQALLRFACGSLKATASGVCSAWMTPPASSKARCTSSCRFWRYAGDLLAQTRI